MVYDQNDHCKFFLFLHFSATLWAFEAKRNFMVNTLLKYFEYTHYTNYA